MRRRLAVAVLILLLIATAIAVPSLARPDPDPAPDDDTEILPGAHWEKSSAPAQPIQLIAADQDPCFDFAALEAGHGDPVRQDWYNRLRTDGGEPDFLRYYVACQPEHNGGRFWHGSYPLARDRRWSTAGYQCIRGLLNGEHGGQAWDTHHPHQPGPNPPQAMPYSKIAGLTMRDTYRWMVDYVNGRYGGPHRTPHPCAAGY